MGIFQKIRKCFTGRGLPEAYQQRQSDEAIWKSTYEEHFGIADTTLRVFCFAFLIPIEDRFKLRPDDSIDEIYRGIYPSKWMPDTLEHMYLIEGMEEKFKFKFKDEELEGIRRLNDLVNKAIIAQPSAPADTQKAACR
jgi:hypothetical protein